MTPERPERPFAWALVVLLSLLLGIALALFL